MRILKKRKVFVLTPFNLFWKVEKKAKIQKIFISKSPIWALLLANCLAPNSRAKAKNYKARCLPKGKLERN